MCVVFFCVVFFRVVLSEILKNLSILYLSCQARAAAISSTFKQLSRYLPGILFLEGNYKVANTKI